MDRPKNTPNTIDYLTYCYKDYLHKYCKAFDIESDNITCKECFEYLKIRFKKE